MEERTNKVICKGHLQTQIRKIRLKKCCDFLQLFEVRLPHEPVCLKVGLSVIVSLKDRKFLLGHFIHTYYVLYNNASRVKSLII